MVFVYFLYASNDRFNKKKALISSFSQGLKNYNDENVIVSILDKTFKTTTMTKTWHNVEKCEKSGQR